MADELFELVFYGKLVDGFSDAQAQSNVAQLFKASPEQVARMFSGSRVVIKNKLDRDTTLKYQMLLRKNGAVCLIEAMGAEAPPPAPSVTPASPAASAPSAAATPTGTAVASRAPRKPRSTEGRLDLAGRKADEILSHSSLHMDPVGVTLSTPKKVETPVFEHLDELSIAPAGSILGEKKPAPAPAIPDTSGLSIAPPGTRLSEASDDE